MLFFNKTPAVSTDDAKIRELLTRGVERIYPSKDALEGELRSGRRLTLYFGIDPTGPTLHLGHLIPLLKLRQFQELGHKVILLIGDFTATIGDPTDKTATRKRLTRGEVLQNARLYKAQASNIISFSGKNAAALRHNAKWLAKFSYEDFHELSTLITTEQLRKRDMFEKREQEGKPIYLHEFVYPLLQGYDSVAMNVDGEVGGNDQTFNMLVGRDLLKKMRGKDKFVVAAKLLTDASGKKMGKTEGNMVALSDTPSDIFGKIMSWPDGMILTGFELCTVVPMSEIEEIRNALLRGENPRDIKARLASAIVALLCGNEAAEKARAQFDAAFKEGKPEEFVLVALAGRDIASALIEKRVVSSKTELRRLIAEGAITNLESNTKMGEDFQKTASPGKYRIGKHRFVEIK